MNRMFMAVGLSLFILNVSAFEEDFSSKTFTNGIPDGWKEAVSHTTSPAISFQNPETIDGGKLLTINFTNAKKGIRILYCETPVGDIVCDNISVDVPIYRKKASSGKIDQIQVVVSTNNFETYALLGVPKALQELNRAEDGWVTNNFSAYIDGLSSVENDGKVLLGLLFDSVGYNSTKGYVGGMIARFVASATPSEVKFVRLEDGVYSEISVLDPHEDRARVWTNIKTLPTDSLSVTNVYAIIERNGSNPATNILTCVNGTEYVGEPLPEFDAGEEIKVSILTEYKAYDLPTLGKQDGQYSYEMAVDALTYNVTKKGSVWINETVLGPDGLIVEFAGTLNRRMTSGWHLAVTNELSETELPVQGVFDFSAKTINGVVGFDTRAFTAAEISDVFQEGINVIKLVNSRGIVESIVEVVKDGVGCSYGMSGIATWNETYGYDYDWTGVADGTFEWVSNDGESSIGTVNAGQGFRVKVSVTATVSVVDSDDNNLPHAAITLSLSNVENVSGQTVFTKTEQASDDGVAEFCFDLYPCVLDSVSVSISALAFGWSTDEKSYPLSLSEHNDFKVSLSCAPAYDDCDTTNSYWRATGNFKWKPVTVDSRKCLQVSLNNAISGTNTMLECKNSLSAAGKRYASVSFDFRNTINASGPYNELVVLFCTEQDWSSQPLEVVSLSNKRTQYVNNQWYSYNAVVELPEGFSEDALWLRLLCRTKGAGSGASIYLDNLRIAFQDVAVATRLERSAEVPASGESLGFGLDVLPQTGDAVKEVSADLHFVLNGVTNVVPFAFADGVYTNSIALVEEEVDGETVKRAVATNLTVSTERLIEEALGGMPLLAGDEVKYFAAVHYNSDNGARTPEELYETRYFPDNSTTDESGRWIVEGDYGVNTNADVLSEYAFTVSGDPLSRFGEWEATAEGIKFNLHGYDANGISSLTVNLNDGADFNQNYTPFEGLDTNSQVRVTGEFRLDSGLAPNTDYTVTITATDVNGSELTPATFTFTTLPVATGAAVSAVSTSVARLSVAGSAAGYVVPSEWTQESATTWLKSGLSPNVLVEATGIYGTNKLGNASAIIDATSGHTLAAAATTAPEIDKGETTVSVKASSTMGNDGNPAGTEYAIRVETSSGKDSLFAEDGETVWKTLAEWKNDEPAVLGSGILDLAATNYVSFVSRNLDGIESLSDVSGECWFDMTATFCSAPAQRDAASRSDAGFGQVDIALEFFDPAASQGAAATVEYSLDNESTWNRLAAFDVPFDALAVTESVPESYTTNLTWDAWNAVGGMDGTYSYVLRATVEAGGRSAVAKAAGSLDFSKPAVLSLSSATPDPFNASDTMAVVATFSEPVEAFAKAAVSVANGSVSSVSGEGAVWTVVAIPSADGNVSVSFAADAVKDRYGNGNTASETLVREFDGTAPTVALSSTTPQKFNADAVFALTAEFSEAVTGFDVNSITVSNGTASNVAGTGATYSFEVVPSGNGLVTVQIEAGKVQDIARNFNAASSVLSREYDTVSPTVTLSSATPDPFNASAVFSVTAVFSEPVSGFGMGSVSVDNGTLTNVEGSGAEYAITISPSGDGNVSVSIGSGVAFDEAGNGNEASNAFSRRYDATLPQVELSSATPARFNAEKEFTVTATFTETVTGFTASSIVVDGGTAGDVSGSGAVYIFKVTPSVANGDISVKVKAGGAFDLAGNGNLESAALSRYYDTTQPSAVLACGRENRYVNDEGLPLEMSLEFSEGIAAVAANDLTTVNCSISDFAGDGTNYTFRVSPLTDALAFSVQLESGKVADIAGNACLASSLVEYIYDNTKPSTPVITGMPFNGSVTNLVDYSLAASSRDAVSAAEDLVYVWTFQNAESSGAAISGSLSGNALYTASVTAMDQAGNVSEAAVWSWTLDTVAPEGLEIAGDPVSGESLVVTNGIGFAFAAENATDLHLPLTYRWTLNGSVADGSSSAFSGETELEGTNIISVSAVDAAGNASSPVENIWVVDTLPPVNLTVSGVPDAIVNSSAFSLAAEADDATELTFHWKWTAGASVNTALGKTFGGNAAEGGNTVEVYAVDEAGNSSATNSYSWVLDITRPEVDVLESTTPAAFNLEASPMVVNVVFSEEVVGFGVNSISVTSVDGGNASVVSVTPVAGVDYAYSVAINPTAEGTFTVQIPQNAVFDIAGNGNEESAVITRRYDNTPPAATVAIENIAGDYFNEAASPLIAKIVFSEETTGLTAASLDVVNGTASQPVAVAGEDNAYTVEVTPVEDGIVSVQVRAGGVYDLAGNGNTVSSAPSRFYDNTPPSVPVFTAKPAILTNEPGFVFTVSSTDNSGTVFYHWTHETENGVAVPENSSASLGGDAAERLNTVSVYASDPAGNMSSAATYSWTLDTVRPTVVALGGNKPAEFNSGSVTVTAKFSEEVSGFDLSKVAITGNAAAETVSGSGDTWTFKVTPGAEGEFSVALASGAAKDAAGNESDASATVLAYVYDTTPPSVSLSADKDERFNTAPLTVTATFTEPVTNFNANTLKVENGAIQSWSGSGNIYTVIVNPVENRDVSVWIEQGATADGAGNGNVASMTLTLAYDTAAPSVTLSSESPVWFNSGNIAVAVDFSEAVTNFTESSVTVTGSATVSVSGNGANYTMTLVPQAEGEITVAVGAGVAADLAGNPNTAAPETLTFHYDTTAPATSIRSEIGDRFNDETFDVTVVFSETVTNFTAALVVVDNGEVVGDAVKVEPDVEGEYAYTVTVDPGTNGMVTVSVPAAVVADYAGNGNLASEPFTAIYDNVAPLVTLSADDVPLKFNDGSFQIKVAFSEKVEGFDAGDVSVENGSVSGNPVKVEDDVEGEYAYFVTIVPDEDGPVTVSVPAGAARDLAGNDSAASDQLVRTYDTLAPTVTLSTEIGEETAINCATEYKIKLTFSEYVTNAVASVLSVQNGTVYGDLEEVDGEPYAYIATIVPEQDFEGELTVSVPAGAVADEAGNGNASSDPLTRACDVKRPGVVTFKQDGMLDKRYFKNNYVNNGKFTVLVTFSEPVTGFDRDSVEIDGVGTLDAVIGSGSTYRVYVNIPSEGDFTVRILAGTASDAAGNTNTAPESKVWTYDNTKPAKPDISGNPAHRDETENPEYSFVATTHDANMEGMKYWWRLSGPNGEVVVNTQLDSNVLSGSLSGCDYGIYSVYVQALDAADNRSDLSDVIGWTYKAPEAPQSVKFGEDITLSVDAETGATNKVAFTSVRFVPGSESTFTLEGFDSEKTGEVGVLMWFEVSSTLAGERTYEQVETTGTYNDGKLTVRLPAEATRNGNGDVLGSFFIFDIKNTAQ